MKGEIHFAKSKSAGNLSKHAQNEEISLLVDVQNEVIAEKSHIEENSDVFSNLNLLQISIYLASFCSTNLGKNSHIMNEICEGFKYIITFSPVYFKNINSQILYNTLLWLPSLTAIFSNILLKLNFLTEQTMEIPGQFIKKFIIYTSIIIPLHLGEAFSFYLSKSNLSFGMILVITITLIIWNYGLYCLQSLRLIDFHGSPKFYIFLYNIPFLMSACNSFCINVIGGNTGVIIMLVIEIIFYIIGVFYRFMSPPFEEIIWNIRIFTTLSLSLLLYATNSINYFIPQITSFTMNFTFFSGLAIILIEHKLSGAMIGNGFRTRHKRPLVKLELQDWAFIGFFVFSIISMTVFNAIAAQRMPITKPLPDIFHELFQCGERIRGSPDFKKTQFSNLLCALLIAGLVGLACCVPEVTNNRKVFILYGIMCWARGIAFTVTSLPAPCSGLPNCPCADPKSIAYINTFNPLMVAVIWVFGLGMFAPIPQCGDLIVSGHTMFMVLTFKWFVEVSRRIVRKSTVRIVQFHCTFTFFLAITYIILARNHYTVDVFFGWLIAETFYELYAYLEKKAVYTTNKTLLVRIVRWFEIRELPIYRRNFEEDDVEPIELFIY